MIKDFDIFKVMRGKGRIGKILRKDRKQLSREMYSFVLFNTIP